MADKKADAKSSKPAAAAPKKAAAATKAAAAAATSSRGGCTVESCKQPLRAKGYCRRHFLSWRRGKLGQHHRYKVCSKEGCRKPREHGGLCAEHAGKTAPAAEGAAAAT